MNDSGFEATGCLSAMEAYDEMYNTIYDLIISDIMMPEIDGFEFAKTVRNVNRTIPILFMSAKDDLPSKTRGFRLGIDDYMVKPVELGELLLRVKALLRRANIEMEHRITMGNLVMDADAYESLGWELDERAGGKREEAKGKKVRLRRERKIINKMELTRLQRNMEACVASIDELERSVTSGATLYAVLLGLVGTAFLAMATFAVVAPEPRILLCVILAIPGFAGWILPLFVYK